MKTNNTPKQLTFEEALEIHANATNISDMILAKQWSRRFLLEAKPIDRYALVFEDILSFFYTAGKVQGIRQERPSRRS